jgi:prepilin-type N-terminal cleavage/methylation domain-containing protein
MKTKSLAGFTLIELLLVIVILGILITIALNVINPARIQRRAREAVMRSQTSKMCAALLSCASTDSTGTKAPCNDANELGINFASLGPTYNTTSVSRGSLNTPAYAGYVIQNNDVAQGWGSIFGPETIRITGSLCGENATGCTADDWVGAKGNFMCYSGCDYNFQTGQYATWFTGQVGCY